ncbi:MAG: hypothetical protein ACMUJM_01255 [bacterium]
MKKLCVLFTVICLVIGVSGLTFANDAITISGEVRVEYDNWLSRDTDENGAKADRQERLYMERAVLKFAVDPGGDTTGAVILRCDGDWRLDTAATTWRADFYTYNAYVKHAMMDNKMALMLGKFNIHIPTVYGISGPNTYSYFYFTKEAKNGLMLNFKPMADMLNINLAVIDKTQEDQGTDTDTRPYDVYLNANYTVMDGLDIYLGLLQTPAVDVTTGENTEDMEVAFNVKYKMDKIAATLEYYQRMLDSQDDADLSVINLGGSYQVTDAIAPYLAVEIIDDGNDLDDGSETLNIILGAHWMVTDNLTYALELDNTSYEDIGTTSVDALTKIGLRARLTF